MVHKTMSTGTVIKIYFYVLNFLKWRIRFADWRRASTVEGRWRRKDMEAHSILSDDATTADVCPVSVWNNESTSVDKKRAALDAQHV